MCVLAPVAGTVQVFHWPQLKVFLQHPGFLTSSWWSGHTSRELFLI